MPIKDLFKDVPNKDKEADVNSISSQDKKIVCQNCGAEVKPTDAVCPNCGMDIDEELESPETNVSQRYPTLNTISGIYITLAVVVIIITAVISMVELVMGLNFLGIAGGIGSLLITLSIKNISIRTSFNLSEI